MQPEEDYIICRCEDVTLRDILEAVEEVEGTVTPSEVKRRARAGMGWCQGRICGIALANVVGATETLKRSQFIRPVELGRLAEPNDGGTE